jgi:hypothetical protein
MEKIKTKTKRAKSRTKAIAAKTKSKLSKTARIVKRKMKTVMHEWKHGKLKSGRSGKKVRNRKQAVAIGLSEARRRGARVPKAKSR